MDSALLIHRLHFAFTVTFHYLFPQLTMGLAPLIVVLKTLAIRRNDDRYNQAARFWAKIFAINFVLGVGPGSPWSSSFAPTGRNFRSRPAAVSGNRPLWQGST